MRYAMNSHGWNMAITLNTMPAMITFSIGLWIRCAIRLFSVAVTNQITVM